MAEKNVPLVPSPENDKVVDDRPLGILPMDSMDELDDFPDYFRCCICLELLYKPVVLECGHVSCFWCVHKAMSGVYISHCPICRHPYRHFPSICQLLHFLLLKICPMIYEKRRKIMLEEEENKGWFSPELPFSLATEKACRESFPHQCHSASGEESRYSARIEAVTGESQNLSLIPSEEPCQERTENPKNIVIIGADICKSTSRSENSNQISVGDVLCASCEELLVQPVVLNCGHVYCKSCLDPTDEGLNCQVCQRPHPGQFPRVCLELDHFLEEEFSKEYSIRRELLHLRLVNCQKDKITRSQEQGKEGGKTCTESMIEENVASVDHGGSMVNVGVGCDSCGMYPILGKWYRCMDCNDKMGFDVCESCYCTKSKLPGRFNQQHTADHRLRLVEPEKICHLFLQFTSEDGYVPLLASEEFINGHLSSDENEDDPASSS